VIGLGQDRNYYLLDFLRDRLNLTERGKEYFRLHRKWRPHKSAYEEYGLQSDIQYLQEMMKGGNGRSPYHFEIEVVAGSLSKVDRINRLIPVCSEGRLWMPDALHRTNSEGKLEELISVLVEQEFLAWPVPVHDDGLDVIARIFDVEDLSFPDPEPEPTPDDRYNRRKKGSTSWMAG
jgi:phage terminase large subunit-like protein